MKLAIMIEGQNGLNWPRWQEIARMVEALGFEGLFRSDHFTNAEPPDLDSLELWTSLTWLASHTGRIAFGPLVTPVSFRHPALTARIAAAVDDLSNGRLVLGLGAGWQEREHDKFGFDLLDLDERFTRFEEGIRVIKALLGSDQPTNFQGKYYDLKEAVLLPRPQRPGGPPILIGGNGPKYTLPLAARYADEWNAVYLMPEQLKELNARLDELIEAEGRSPEDVRRSMMAGIVYAPERSELERKVEKRTNGKRSVEDLRSHGVVIGNAEEVVDQLKRIEAVGLDRVMLQWLDLEDLDGLEGLAESVLPSFS